MNLEQINPKEREGNLKDILLQTNIFFFFNAENKEKIFFFPQFRALPSFIYLQAGSGDAKSPVHMQSFTSQPLQSKSEGRKVVSVNCDEDDKEKFEVLGKCMDQANARVQKPRKIF